MFLQYKKKIDVKFSDERTITNSGEANMDMRDATVKYPTKICRVGGSNSLVLT